MFDCNPALDTFHFVKNITIRLIYFPNRMNALENEILFVQFKSSYELWNLDYKINIIGLSISTGSSK